LQLDFKQIKEISGVTASDLVPGFNKYQGLLNAPIDRLTAETFGHEGAHGLFSIDNPAEAVGASSFSTNATLQCRANTILIHPT